MSETREHFRFAELADAEFQAELARVHGHMAGDYRYQPKRDTPRLAELRAAYRAARELYYYGKGN